VRSSTVDSIPTLVGRCRDQVDLAVEVLEHVPGFGGETPDERLALGAAIGTPASRIKSRRPSARGSALRPCPACGHDVRDARRAASTRVSGPGQKRRARSAARSGHSRRTHGPSPTVGVDDERVERGAALGREDPRDGLGVRRVGAESVDGLGREGDEPAAAEDRRGLSQGLGLGLVSAGRDERV